MTANGLGGIPLPGLASPPSGGIIIQCSLRLREISAVRVHPLYSQDDPNEAASQDRTFGEEFRLGWRGGAPPGSRQRPSFRSGSPPVEALPPSTSTEQSR